MNFHKTAVKSDRTGRSPSTGQLLAAPREGDQNGEMGERRGTEKHMHANKLEMGSYAEDMDLKLRQSVGSEVSTA